MKFVWDGGHGYNTSGKRTVDGSMREWEFNNAVAQKADVLLKEYKDVETLFVHDTTGKTDVPLSTRVKKANDWKADAYVSIHANASGDGTWNEASGIETFHSPNASTTSKKLATNIQKELIAKTGRKDRGVKSEAFYVIKNTNAPAILTECGFMTNEEEAKLLKSDDYRQKCAEAIVLGLAETFALKKKSIAAPEQKVQGVSEVKEDKHDNNQPFQLFRLETGAFNDRLSADRAAEKLRSRFKWIVHVNSAGQKFRLVTGTFNSATEADEMAEVVRKEFGWWIYIINA